MKFVSYFFLYPLQSCNMTYYILVLKVLDLKVQKWRFSCNNALSFHLFFKLSYYMVNIHSFFFFCLWGLGSCGLDRHGQCLSSLDKQIVMTQQESDVKPGHWQHYFSALNIEALMAAPVSPIRSRQHYLLMPDHSLPLRLSYSPHSQMPPALPSNDSCHLSQYEGICNKPGLMNQTNNESERAGVPV